MSWLRRHPLSALVLLLLIAALAYTLPPVPRQPFCEASAWGLVVLASLIGYGSALRFWVARDARIDLGLRAAWGAAVLCFVGGLLALVSLMTFDVALVLVVLGAVLFGFFTVREAAGVERGRRFLSRIARREPLLFGFGLLLLAMLALQFFGAVANWHTNPYDDDIAYLAFAKKLADTGTLIEPFSLRRLSALGGQTFFLELVGVRAHPSQSFTFDYGICSVIAVLLLWGYRNGRRRPPLLFVLLVSACLLTLQNISINTGSYFSGLVFFFASYRTLEMFEVRLEALLPLALVTACTMTLRQNYLPTTFVMLAAAAWWAFRRARTIRQPLMLAAFTLAALLPWLLLSWRSNHTLLYPMMTGTANTALDLQSSTMTWLGELKMLFWVALEVRPMRVLPLFLIVLALLRRSAGKSVRALLLASIVGFIATVHGLTQSDPLSISRYIFGFTSTLAFAIVFAAAIAAVRDRSRVTLTAAGLALLALGVQLVASSETLYPAYQQTFANIAAAQDERPRPARAQGWVYDKLQGVVPAGERIAVLLDEPYFLHFDRNRIFNLDMPGYASLPPGMPYFLGSEALRSYFRGIGIRYVAFVRGDRSRYHYRRDYWLMMLVSDENELWRNHAPYVIDLVDSLSDLAKRYSVLFEEHGMVVVDLGAA